jgi:UDP-3-O-[3-hydroxymyristoyl] glucosamine N-acyltransferase
MSSSLRGGRLGVLPERRVRPVGCRAGGRTVAEAYMDVMELARRLGAEVAPGLSLEITGVAPMDEAGPGDLTFLSNASYARRLKDSRAAAVLVDPAFAGESAPAPLRIKNPYLAFARAIEIFHPAAASAPGVHPTAVLGRDVVLGRGVSVGPFAVLGDGVAVGDGSVLHAHAVLYAGARLGARCVVHSHAVVRERVRLGDGVILQNGAVVGADGFGFAPRGDGTWHKIPQVGVVELGDDVEVQANACIDRATVGRTTVGRGTKIDNLVQVGHGCRIGDDSLLCGQVGLAGTTRVGNRVTLAGQVGTAGHQTIGDGATVAAQAGVAGDIEPGATVAGSPAMDIREAKLVFLSIPRLPELLKRVKALEKTVEKAVGTSPDGGAADAADPDGSPRR